MKEVSRQIVAGMFACNSHNIQILKVNKKLHQESAKMNNNMVFGFKKLEMLIRCFLQLRLEEESSFEWEYFLQ